MVETGSQHLANIDTFKLILYVYFKPITITEYMFRTSTRIKEKYIRKSTKTIKYPPKLPLTDNPFSEGKNFKSLCGRCGVLNF